MAPDPSSPSPPAASPPATLLQRFGAGWEQGQADRIADLFTPDGVFVPGPFDPPLTGRDAIVAYWRDLPLEQAEVSFRVGEIFVAGPWFATEFKCTFRRRRTGEKVVVKGALFCETAGELLGEMRMYWDRVVQRSTG
jgi:ketosteroid isomerase-like protein